MWHIKCANVTPQEYKDIEQNSDPWICNLCNNFNFSESFFDTSLDLSFWFQPRIAYQLYLMLIIHIYDRIYILNCLYLGIHIYISWDVYALVARVHQKGIYP
jgi:hypothetical protein